MLDSKEPPDLASTWTAFAGHHRVGGGDLATMAIAVKAWLDEGHDDGRPILVFNDDSGAQVDFDFSGAASDVLVRFSSTSAFPSSSSSSTSAEPPKRGPGRPKLGVVSREVSLLPRHWAWLEAQPGGLSAALRRLVEEARRDNPPAERRRRTQEAAGRFMWAVAGNLPGFEEASRALYADDRATLLAQMSTWPVDVATHVETLLDR